MNNLFQSCVQRSLAVAVAPCEIDFECVPVCSMDAAIQHSRNAWNECREKCAQFLPFMTWHKSATKKLRSFSIRNVFFFVNDCRLDESRTQWPDRWPHDSGVVDKRGTTNLQLHGPVACDGNRTYIRSFCSIVFRLCLSRHTLRAVLDVLHHFLHWSNLLRNRHSAGSLCVSECAIHNPNTEQIRMEICNFSNSKCFNYCHDDDDDGKVWWIWIRTHGTQSM